MGLTKMTKKKSYVEFKGWQVIILLLSLSITAWLLILGDNPIIIETNQEVDKCVCECIVEQKEVCDFGNITFSNKPKLDYVNFTWNNWFINSSSECRTCWEQSPTIR